MSNAVDLIILDGPHTGVMVCQPKPVPATITHEGEEYTTAIHDEQYHVAYQDEAALDDAEYWIAVHSLQPSWDLRS